MTWGLVKTFGPYVAMLALLIVVGRQHDQLVTWRLKDKDYQAVVYNLRGDLADAHAKITANASAEASDRGDADKSCAADISSSFQKGVAVGRAISNAPKSAPPAGQPAAGVVRDYREEWSRGAFRPAA